MSPLPLLFLLVSTTGAFSPTAVLPSQNAAIGISATPRCISSSHHLSCRRVASPHRTPFRNVNSNEINLFHTPTSLASTAAVANAASTIEKDRLFNYKQRTAILLAFMTGWADLMFVTKYNFFATMMTGNSMKMALALVNGRVKDTLFYLAIICSYIFGVGIFRRTELSFKNKSVNGLFAPIVAACFIFSDYLSWIKPSCKFVPAILLSFAWAIINSVGSEVTGTLVFVLTGAMTRLSNMMVDRISRTAGRKKIPKEGCLMSLGVIGGFISGAAWCAFLNIKAPQLASFGAFSIMGGIYGLFFLWMDREQFGAWWNGDGELCDIDAEGTDCN